MDIANTFTPTFHCRCTTPKSTELITEGFACDPMLLQKEGTQVINVSYGGKTTTFTVNVKAANHDHKWGAWEVDPKSRTARPGRP